METDKLRPRYCFEMKITYLVFCVVSFASLSVLIWSHLEASVKCSCLLVSPDTGEMNLLFKRKNGGGGAISATE